MESRMLRITLNVDVQSMFPLLGLTWESPGPIEVDPGKIPEQHMLWIKNAQARNVLKVEDLNPTKTESVIVSKDLPLSKTEESQKLKQGAADKRAFKEAEAKKTLKAPASALSSFVNSSNDLVILRIMLTLEGEGKNRPKVVDLLNKRISELQAAVGSIVGEPLDSSAQLVTDRNLKNLPEVEEEEEKTVTINRE